MRFLKGLWDSAKIVVVVLVSAVAIRYLVLQPFQVEGASMEPNLQSGQLMLVEKLSYRLHAPKRGDIIVFHYPLSPRVDYIKRIIGLPGETIRISEGRVLVDNRLLEESYLPAETKTTIAGIDAPYESTLGPEQFFVLGDNRPHSSDSRNWGPLDRRFIIGRSGFILYPANSFRAIASPNYH